jgi:hypothetical protein
MAIADLSKALSLQALKSDRLGQVIECLLI